MKYIARWRRGCFFGFDNKNASLKTGKAINFVFVGRSIEKLKYDTIDGACIAVVDGPFLLMHSVCFLFIFHSQNIQIKTLVFTLFFIPIFNGANRC